MDPTALLEAIREACPAGYWSRGVKIARAGQVVGQSSSEEEVVLRVAIPGAPVAFTVHLWPADEDWSCDCSTEHDACAHVAASVIAWSQALKLGVGLPRAGVSAGQRDGPARAGPGRAPATLGYRLKSTDGGFSIERVTVRLDEEKVLDGTIRGRSGQAVGNLLSTEADLAVEEIMGFRFGRSVPREVVFRLLPALADCPDVTLDGAPARISGQPVLPVGRVEDDDKGFVVRTVRDPGITRVFRNGCVLCEGVLRPVGSAGLTADQRLVLDRGMRFAPHEVGRLVAEVIPDLRKKVPVDVRTRRLPAAGDGKPRLVVQADGGGEVLHVRADIVYGDPPSGRIVRGDLEYLGGPVPIRDRRLEEALSREASEKLGIPVGMERELHGPDAVRFVDRSGGWRGDRKGQGWQRFRRVAAIEPQVRIDGDRLSVDFGGADPVRMVEAWMAGADLMPVADGWAPLPLGWLEQHGHLVADLLAARDEDGRVAKHALFDLARLAHDLDQPTPPGFEGLRVLLDDFGGIPRAALPSDLRAELRPYQRQGVDWLSFLGQAGLGGILADDMGLGKTLQALCALRGRTLVVAPTSVVHNWVAEARRFRPGLRVSVYHGPARVLDSDADLTVTTFGLLRLDVDRLAREEWGTVVLDEAQAIKNPDSQVARAAYRMQAGLRLTLTGTPVENRLEELWSQFHFLNPGLLGGRRDFDERYSKPIATGEPGAAARLRERIRPFVLRRLKRDVAPELPPRTDMVLECELSSTERAAYDAVRAATRASVVEQLGHGGSVLAALEALLRLRQAACHTGLLPGQTAESSSKVDLLVDTLDEVVSEGHKALVFSQWTGMLDRIEPHLRASGIDFCRLDGSTTDRGGVVGRFQDPAGPPVFLVSLKAGGTGLNLTAADHVFLVDPWWNPAAEDQAADRAHRIGQDKPVMVYRLVAENTVEERILALQERKRALADAALGEADRATGITRDELMALLA